jgi:hypothetical protein
MKRMRVLSYETRWEQDTARGVCFMCQLIRPNIRRRHRRPWCDSYNRRHTVRNNGDFLVPKTAGPGCTRYVCVCVRACFKSPPHPSQGGMGRYTPPMAGSLHPTGPGTFGGGKRTLSGQRTVASGYWTEALSPVLCVRRSRSPCR